MDGGKISPQTFPVEPGDHSEVWCLRQIQRVADRYDRSREFQFVSFANGQPRRDLVHFQDGCPAANVCHELMRRISLAVEFDCEIARFASDCVCRVECSGRIDEETGAANFAVLVYAMNLNDRFGCPLEKLPDLLADRRGGLLLSEKPTRA